MNFTEETLRDIAIQAEHEATRVMNPSWQRAYFALADKADHLALMFARCTIKASESNEEKPNKVVDEDDQ